MLRRIVESSKRIGNFSLLFNQNSVELLQFIINEFFLISLLNSFISIARAISNWLLLTSKLAGKLLLLLKASLIACKNEI